MERQHMIVRANELARMSGGRITAADLTVKLAAEFRDASDEALLDYCSKIVSSSVIEPDLPPDGDSEAEQLALPGLLTGFLRVRTADGLEFVEADVATGDEALSSMTSKQERHSTQARRAAKKLQEIRIVMAWEGYEKSRTYNTNCQRYRRALEAGE